MMRDTEIPELNLEMKEEIEATVESEERLFSNGLDDTGYILNTDDGEREWHLKDDKVEGDDFERGDRILIKLEDRRKMKPWPRGTSRSSSSRNEPERIFRVENLSSEEED